MHVHTLQLNDQELELLHNSLETWINSFSHDEADLLRAGKQLRAKIDAEREHQGANDPATAEPVIQASAVIIEVDR